MNSRKKMGSVEMREFEEMMDMPLQEHAKLIRLHMALLEKRGIGGFFLLTDEHYSEGGIIGAHSYAMVGFICDLLENEAIREATAEEMENRKHQRERNSYDA